MESTDNHTPNLTRGALKTIAAESLKAIEKGSYTLQITRSSDTPSSVKIYDLRENVENLKGTTVYYGPDSILSSWKQVRSDEAHLLRQPQIWAIETSTLETARRLVDKLASGPHVPERNATPRRGSRSHAVGVLNFASAKNPGGSFLNGTPAQEESIARASTLYPSLTCPTGQQYYTYNHTAIAQGNDGYFSHAMVYSPSILVFRDDNGGWMAPYEIDVLTSPAVNAGAVRQLHQQALDREEQPKESETEIEEHIRVVMKERMARILYLFELQGVQDLVLGSFGTGIFKNNVDMVVDLWEELLVGEAARFGRSFEKVAFGVIGHETYVKFEKRFGTGVA